MEEKSELISFKASPELKEKAERAAEQKERTLSSYMRRVLRLALRAESEPDEEKNGRREAVAA